MSHYVIAGGSKGIGLDLVRRLSVAGNSVQVYSRQLDDLELSDKISHFACDFTEPTVDLPHLPESISGVAYCPGSINLRSFRGLSLEDFQQDLEINLLGAIKFLKACLPGLKKNATTASAMTSSVVLFSSVAVGRGLPMHASIASAKGAVEGLARTLAAEWAPKIRVNCLAPALTETPLSAKFFSSEESRNALGAKYPLQRTGVAQDIASIAEFLLSENSSWITGQVIGVDGGMSTLTSS